MNGPTFVAAPPTPVTSSALVPAPVPRARIKPAPRPEAVAAPPPAVLSYLKLHWLTILFCGTLLGGVLGYAAFTLVPVKYESFAEVQVASNPFSMTADANPQGGQTAFATFIKTTRIQMVSEPVLTAAVSNPAYKIDKLPTLAGEPDPVKFLRERLVVESPENSEIIRVSLIGVHSQDLKPIVDAVLAAYKEQVLEVAVTKKRREKLDLEKTWDTSYAALQRQLGATGTSRANFSPLGTPAPAGELPALPTRSRPDDPSAPAVIQAGFTSAAPAAVGLAILDLPEVKKARAAALVGRIDDANDKLERLRVAIPMAERAAADLKAQADSLAAVEPSEAALAAADGDPEVQALKQAARARDNEVRTTVGTANNPNSAAAQDLKRRAQEAHDAAKRLQRKKAGLIENRDLDARRAQAQDRAYAAARELQALKESSGSLQKVRQQMADELAAIRVPAQDAEVQGPALDLSEVDIRSRGEVFQSLTRRMALLELELTAPSRVSLPPTGASIPREKDGKKPLMAAAAAVLIGYGLVAGLLLAHEVRTRKVSSLGELPGVGAKVLGVIPHSPDAQDPLKRHDIAESIHKLRAVVAQEWLGRGAATVVVTSTLGDEGKAFCAYRLALSLAESGTRTLLVDFDLRQPSVHLFAGVPNTAGVADILRGEADIRSSQVILPSGLVVLPAGDWRTPDDPDATYPALGGALDPLLHRLRAEVDVLVVHGHALLTAADTVELARRADAVLLCATFRETRLALLKRAAERIAGMAGPEPAVIYLGATRHEALC